MDASFQEHITIPRQGTLWTLHTLRTAWAEFWNVQKPHDVPSRARREEAAHDLNHILSADPSIARLILGEVKSQVDIKRASNRQLQSKASSFIGFATAVLAFGVTANAASLIKFNWWEWLPALVLQCFSIVSATLAIATNEYDLPDATLFNAATTLRDNRNEARIAMALAEAWAFRELAIGAVNRTVSRRVMVSAFTFLSGVLYIASAVLLTTAVNALRVRTKEKSGDLIIKGFASTHTTSGPQKTPQTSSLNNGRNSTVSTSDKPTGTPKPAGGGEPCRESGKPTPAPSPK